MVSYQMTREATPDEIRVLILIVVEDGLVPF